MNNAALWLILLIWDATKSLGLAHVTEPLEVLEAFFCTARAVEEMWWSHVQRLANRVGCCLVLGRENATGRRVPFSWWWWVSGKIVGNISRYSATIVSPELHRSVCVCRHQRDEGILTCQILDAWCITGNNSPRKRFPRKSIWSISAPQPPTQRHWEHLKVWVWG